MSGIVRSRPPTARSLLLRREALLARIAVARGQTADAGRRLSEDLQAAARTQRSMLGGLKLAKASLAAAGVIWSLNATTRLGRGSRFLTIALSVLSTLRLMRRVRAFLMPLAPLAPSTQIQA
ncbi:MAG: hypothetical protein ABI790_02110 [Betaproteobacteria bacterium]